MSLLLSKSNSASVSFLVSLARRTSTLERNDDDNSNSKNDNNREIPFPKNQKTREETVKKTVKPKPASQNYWKSTTATATNTTSSVAYPTSHTKRSTKTNNKVEIRNLKSIPELIVSSVAPLSVFPSPPQRVRQINTTTGDSSNHGAVELKTNDTNRKDRTPENNQQIDALMDTIFNNMSLQLPLYRYSNTEQLNGSFQNGETSPEERQRLMEEKMEEHIININGKVESRIPTNSNVMEEDVSLPNNSTTARVHGLDLSNFTKNNGKEILLDDKEVLCPRDLLPADENGNTFIPYPKSLSPSAILEFMDCPQSYLFQYLLGLRQPTSLVLAKGSMCHHALQRVFDLEPSKRSLSVLQNLFRTAWQENRLSDTYKPLFEKEEGVRDLDKERKWGREGLALLENYWKLEDASKVQRPNPLFREQWVMANLTVVSPPILIRGIVDRLDMVQDTKHSVAMRLIDYKSGKAPDLKYSRAMNEKIERDKFFQLLIYAWLLHASGKTSQQLPLRYLRLLYLTSEGGTAQTLDWDLGSTVEQRESVLTDVGTQLERVWNEMKSMIDQQDLMAFRGCRRSFCWCHVCRARMVPGAVWTPEDESNNGSDSGSSSSSNTAMTARDGHGGS
jgi:RecB family exonuclease